MRADNIDRDLPVLVYRGLQAGPPLFTIRQRGHERVRSRRVALRGVRFVVCAAGRDRARAECLRNVHAFAYGFLVPFHMQPPLEVATRIRYSPYDELAGFVDRAVLPGGTSRIVTGVRALLLSPDGMFGWGLTYL